MPEFSFRNVKKKFHAVELWDGTKVMLKYPSYGDFNAILNLTKLADGNYSQAILDDLAGLTARLLSNNLEGHKVTADDVKNNLGVEDIMAFFQDYIGFVNGLVKDPN